MILLKIILLYPLINGLLIKKVITLLEYQVDIGCAQNYKSLKSLIVAQQTEARKGVPNKANYIAFLDNLNVRKYHVDIDGVRSPKDGVTFDCASKGYLEQYRNLNFVYEEYVGKTYHVFL